jgi:hypothetical protein
MSDSDRKDTPDQPKVAVDSQRELDFDYLAANPTVSGWKRKILSLIHGGSDGETLSRLGSIEQYIRVLRRESKDRAAAEFCFSEALAEVVMEWTPTLAEPANRLYHFLSLIAAFTPRVGFSKTLSYLERTDKAKRTAEFVNSEQRIVDLYKKGLIAIGRYYQMPPVYAAEDQGFEAYKQLLNRNLQDQRYCAYAAIKLLHLGVLPSKSESFLELFLESDEVSTTFIKSLASAAEITSYREPVVEVLGDLLLACAASDQVERFARLAATVGLRFDPHGDYKVVFPTLMLAGGKVLGIPVDLSKAQETPLRQYIGYSVEKLIALFKDEATDPKRIGRYASAYIAQALGTSEVESILEALEFLGIKLTLSAKQKSFVLVPARQTSSEPPDEIIITLDPTSEGALLQLKWDKHQGRSLDSVLKDLKLPANASGEDEKSVSGVTKY